MSHILLRIVEGASVALYRHKDESLAELLPTRRDLFDYDGGYGWGYGGSGPQNLAHAIAGRIFLLDGLDDKQLRERAWVILDKIISRPILNTDSDHDLSVDSIKQLFA
ncbi:hypothetical protein PK69_18005 [Xanthomonas phaseoli pv. phaseoli]|uniref:Uncharacterized protein n=1 Tax=Xanthomonas campestris pv. phaseoli TaxID=317013 RepID=A0AB38DZ17_XANCH|nr:MULTISPECIES: hypothetical protein [Xanthomonas]ATS24106.1 hypothetical protein XppCFBP412P_22670 [Xanthomonas phaseoli pv. phaseoli]ATS28424.1 hypothetical protein XppCFBP6164P_23845 [Xanthomonas phaseoli pv. phaseoli]ATS32413.1 hypothetical protein XppCFBP6546P_23020 [Xanthomonas phaseoli pv. phaseoli]ATS36605.1 hypothetical protein XppCFBP6982P_22920 [Xanthomonas phaseoli pv. phaseoli]AZU15424.1 hypothetical protein AC609_22725 [Xanthomonas phaseoli pv. phaseoli]